MGTYNYKTPKPTSLNINNSLVGETLEEKIERIVNNKEPITDGAPIIFTERKDGIKPAYDIRTDRWEIAVEAMDTVSRTNTAKREERHKPEAKIVDIKPPKEGEKEN